MGVVVLFLLPLGGLRVVRPAGLQPEGPLVVAPFAFGPRDFRVQGTLVLTTEAHWDYAHGCPPRFVGPRRALSGHLVLHRDPDIGRCSPEMHVVAAGKEGALLWLFWQDDLLLFNPIPGSLKFYWSEGDSRALAAPPAADITATSARPVVEALAAGTEVHVDVTGDKTAFEELWGGPLWVVWRVIIVLQMAFTIELCAVRLEAFARHLRRLEWCIPIAVLTLELVTNLTRAIYVGLDPFRR